MKAAVPLALALLALAVRLGYLLELGDDPLFESPGLGAAGHVGQARDACWRGSAVTLSQSPLYVGLLGLLGLAGKPLWLPRLLQAGAGAAACALTWTVGRQLFCPGVALTAALAMAAYGPLVYAGGELLPIPWTVVDVMVLLWLLLRTPTLPAWRWSIPGLAVGIAGLLTPTALFLLPFLLWWLWRRPDAVRGGSWDWRPGLWLVAGCLVLVAPVAVCSWLYGGDVEALDVSRVTVTALGQKLYTFWRGAEVGHSLNPYFARDTSRLLSVLLWQRGLAFPFGLVAPLALVGLALYLRAPSGRTRQGLLPAGLVLVWVAAGLAFPVSGQSRLPVVPVLLLFACHAVGVVIRGPGRLAIVGAATVLALLLNAGDPPVSGAAHGHYRRGQAYDARDMPANAMREYRHALRLDPELPQALLRLAASVARRGEHSQAVELYRRYLRVAPDSIGTGRELAMALTGAGRHGEALEVLSKLVAAAPGRADLQGSLAFVSLRAGRPKQAATAYRRVLALRPDSVLVRYQLARLHETLDQPDSAAAQYRVVMATAPRHAGAHRGLADLLIAAAPQPREGAQWRASASLQEAEHLLIAVIDIEPQSLATRWSLGRLLARQGRYQEAVGHFERILELAPDEYRAHLLLGGLYQRTGRLQEAEQQFRRYSEQKRARRLQTIARAQSEELVRQILGEAGAGTSD